ncbi:MAG: Bax inhibitor-1 family protein [Candidatus Peribacteraceae bacterium]|nr:Bax inhibitor-1 family protein [Candidatus Peribacteraceae bacterium]
MDTFSSPRSRPLTLSHSVEAQVYGYFALALALTLLGIYAGMQYADALLSGGVLLLCVIAEFALILSARFWMERSLLNVVLFGLFPILSGITVTPYLLYAVGAYVNGGNILFNAFAATAFMAGAAAVFARTTRWDLGVLGKALIFGVLGLLFLGLLQIFIPSLQGGQMELLISGGGIVIFALFTAYDVQRIQALGRSGANPFLLALSLYLDIFNLFLFILRFMLAISGNRRQSW